ncbi:MAG: hypothetical protein GTO51_05310 [Candidatus Latescibacteria bacterium]|nr:hypothetical protein [Candidatus Latescibacterota bacterium]NIO28421.1 hypothetical protein [Candidatus Latescibacterota bacterium]NIO55970.1 hypothetical protein [Candidatus Latescibacterota bacterium]NIT01934.1 hypothetical protein [Candidatus Latescibacterota bacterium]
MNSIPKGSGMGFDKHISESAFLVNESRARNVDLSRDIFAHLWVDDSTQKLWDDFSREVYPHDEIELSLRNRFFLDCLNSHINADTSIVFVNVGAGFTSYPFLTNKPCRCIEVDYAHVIDFKRKKIEGWQEEGIVPKRGIDYIAADLNNKLEMEELGSILGSHLKINHSFILLEGLTYYLEMPVLRNLLAIFSELQVGDSILTFDFWTPDSADHPVFIRFREFFSKRFGYKEARYNLFDADFVRSIPGYSVVEITSIQDLEKVYSKTTFLSDYENILPEQYAVLMKNA